MKQTPETIRNLIVEQLHKYTGIPVIPEYEIFKAPKYPYISYKITTAYMDTGNKIYKWDTAPGTEGFETDAKETLYTQPKLNIIINAYSQDDIEAMTYAKKCMDWLTHIGRVELEDHNIVVVDTSNIIDKTIHIVDNYEQRYGFDVEIRYTDIVENTIPGIEEANLTTIIKKDDNSIVKEFIVSIINRIRGKKKQ